MSFPAEGQSVTLFMQDMDRRRSSNDGGKESPKAEKSRTHDEQKQLDQIWRLKISEGLAASLCTRSWYADSAAASVPILTFTPMLDQGG